MSNDIRKWRDILENRLLATPEYALEIDAGSHEFVRAMMRLYSPVPHECGDYDQNYMFFGDKDSMKHAKTLLKAVGLNPRELPQQGCEEPCGNLQSPYPGNNKIR